MNYSDYDSDGYSSNEDADYVPSDGSHSEDDINECEKEDPLNENDEVPHPGSVHKGKKKNKEKSMSRKRKKGIFKVENAEEDKDKVEGTDQLPFETRHPRQPEEEEARQKKKSDDLWASFLCDVGSRPKQSTAATDSDTKLTGDTQSSTVKTASPKTETKPAEPAKVTITKVFDFAGEEVRVNKEVAADSREARDFLKSQEKQEEEEEEESASESPSSATASCGTKRSAGLSGILGRIGGKKQKMSTLEKSKMDWDAFKSEEGISDELAIHNRGREGYVERKNFLERVDHRQFEIEKTVRLSNMKQ
ncbi:craniofacial development protein 1 [Eucyclogobius newberryi]|uniref:craniofacial development protein 1 n=1 Tax=Eucyclogobius newberryi TaxID=166745 RepID=UPI003B5AC1DC